MSLVKKRIKHLRISQLVENEVIPPIIENTLLNNFNTQLDAWKRHLHLAIDFVDNRCVLIFNALFIVELWLKLIIIERLSLYSYSYVIEDCDICIDGRNRFALDMVRHNIGKTLKALIKSDTFVDERTVLMYVYQCCEFLAQEASISSLDAYSDLKYNYKDDRQLATIITVDQNIKELIWRLIDYAEIQRTNSQN